jgi:hypothetical protein
MTLLGSVLFLILCFAFIFFGARSCVATQEATQIRKYVTSADSTLSDSANVGNEELQATVAAALEDPASLDAAAVDRASDAAQRGYREALRNEEVPPEFEDAHHYMITALGMRAAATGELAEAAEGGGEEFGETVPAAVEDYKLSDAIIVNHYLPASEEALAESGRRGDQNYLYEPRSFMDYEALGLSTRSRGEYAPEEPSAPRAVSIFAVSVAGRPLIQGGNVVLTGQAIPATVERIEPGGQATVEVSGFKPGEFDETAEVSVKAGPVKYEQDESNNVLTGTVTFGI